MFIKKLYRQHTTTVLAIPKMILEALDLKAGDYVELEAMGGGKEIRMAKIKGRLGYGSRNEDDKSDGDRGGQA